MDQLNRRQASEVRRTVGPMPLVFARRLIWAILGVIEVILALRFLLRLLAANPDAGFTTLVYGASDPLVSPFRAVFGTPQLGGGSALEIGTLLAMLVYALVAWGLVALLNAIFAALPQQSVERVERYDAEDREREYPAAPLGPPNPYAPRQDYPTRGTYQQRNVYSPTTIYPPPARRVVGEPRTTTDGREVVEVPPERVELDEEGRPLPPAAEPSAPPHSEDDEPTQVIERPDERQKR